MPWRRHPSPAVDIAGATGAGPRPENQDRWAAGGRWAVVCDGVGGHAGGAVAAQTALDVVVAHLDTAPPTRAVAAERRLREAVAAANDAVVDGRAAGPAVADMATTVTAAVAVPGHHRGRRWVVVQVGDSPAWRVGRTTARSITWDHNLVGDLVRAGVLPADDAIGHRGRNVVTRALGAAPTAEPELFTVDLDPEEVLVLASDGLSDVVGPDAAIGPCADADDAGAAAHALVALALARHTTDNVTVVVAR